MRDEVNVARVVGVGFDEELVDQIGGRSGRKPGVRDRRCVALRHEPQLVLDLRTWAELEVDRMRRGEAELVERVDVREIGDGDAKPLAVERVGQRDGALEHVQGDRPCSLGIDTLTQRSGPRAVLEALGFHGPLIGFTVWLLKSRPAQESSRPGRRVPGHGPTRARRCVTPDRPRKCARHRAHRDRLRRHDLALPAFARCIEPRARGARGGTGGGGGVVGFLARAGGRERVPARRPGREPQRGPDTAGGVRARHERAGNRFGRRRGARGEDARGERPLRLHLREELGHEHAEQSPERAPPQAARRPRGGRPRTAQHPQAQLQRRRRETPGPGGRGVARGPHRQPRRRHPHAAGRHRVRNVRGAPREAHRAARGDAGGPRGAGPHHGRRSRRSRERVALRLRRSPRRRRRSRARRWRRRRRRSRSWRRRRRRSPTTRARWRRRRSRQATRCATCRRRSRRSRRARCRSASARRRSARSSS